MIVKGLGHTESLNEVVLFPFDDYAIPLQRGLRLRLHSFRKWVDQSSNIVVGLGGPGDPDNVICTYYGTVRRVGDELWMCIAGYEAANCSGPVRSGLRQQAEWGSRETVEAEAAVRIRVDFSGVRPEDVRLYAVYLQH